MSLPTTGSPAPGFTLQDNNGAEVSLSDFKGVKNILVYFYPKAMTPGCTIQAQGLRDIAAELEGLDVVVLGISPRSSKASSQVRGARRAEFSAAQR
jgi:peroxiredoxin Q/BCP